MADDVRKLLDEQIEYYRVRAPEYDEWCDRAAGYDIGPEAKAVWDRDVAVVADALREFAPTGKVLELACGTGWWTQRLATYASTLTCVDASHETMAIAATKAPGAHYVQADIFTWEPDDAYDVVFFSFWISHVPASLFEDFWEKVGRALVPGGRAFFVDNLNRPVPGADGIAAFLQKDDQPGGLVVRTLNDGSEFRAVKIYYEPDELESRLRSLGWDASVSATDHYFYWGTARRG
jgi:demethylmenaquinone methyltransferase/2-methoxy-6-polyprenyl-1,4-benzoquinol methylase